jgi:hypothetical protein
MNHSRSLLATFLLASMSIAAAGCSGADTATGTSEAELSNPSKTAYNFFISKGLKSFQAAGIVGNLMQESNVIATSVQYGGGAGRGIAQWSVGGRWDHDSGDNMAWYASKHGLDRWSLTAQLDFIWYELTSFGGYGLSALRGSTNVVDATIAFERDFEGCGQCDESTRIAYAEQVLGSHGGGGGGGGGKACYSYTMGHEMPMNACVQSKYDRSWYQCDNGDWVDRWTDPAACDGVHPL